MYLFNAIGSLFKSAYNRICCRSENHEERRRNSSVSVGEISPLLMLKVVLPKSFGEAEYEDYDDSREGILFSLALLIIYVIVGIVAFSFVLEQWTIIDSLYFTIVTFTTVGYGDLTPDTDVGRIFVIFFSLYGVVIIGIALGILSGAFIEYEEKIVLSAKEGAKNRVLQMFETTSSENDKNYNGEANSEPNGTKKKTPLHQEILNILWLESPLIAVILISSLIIGYIEKWRPIESIYYAIVTSTTIGFGDYEPTKRESKILVIIFLPLAVAVAAEILGRVASLYMKRKNEKFQQDFLHRELSLGDLDLMDIDKSGHVDLGEFLSFMLVAMQKVDKEDIDELKALFHSLDADGSGVLSRKDLKHKASIGRKGILRKGVRLEPQAAPGSSSEHCEHLLIDQFMQT